MKQDLTITVAKYCIHWHFLSNSFLLHPHYTPQKKVFKTWTRAQSAHRLLMWGWMLLLICLQLLSKTKSHSCDPVGRRQVFEASGTAVRSESAAGGCVNSGVRSRLALIIHTGRVQQGIPRTVPTNYTRNTQSSSRCPGTDDTVCRTWWTSTLSDIWLFWELFMITEMVVLPVLIPKSKNKIYNNSAFWVNKM